MHRTRRARAAGPVGLVLTALALTACGSTVQQTGSGGDVLSSGGGVGGGGLGQDATLSPDGLSVPGGSGTSDLATGAPGVPGGFEDGGSTAAAGPAAAGVAGSSAAAGGGPVTGAAAPEGSGPVHVGVYVVDNAEAFYDSVGADNSLGDNRKQSQAVIDEINRTGGFAGREVKPKFGVVDFARPEASAQVSEQRLCDEWTQDEPKVVAAVVIVRVGVLADCLTKRGVPLAVVAPENFTEGQFARWPLTFAPASVSHEDGARLLVDRAKAQGYFTKTGEDLFPQLPLKLGYLYYETPEQQRVARQVFEPAVKAAGTAEVVSVGIPYPNTSQEGSQAIAAIQSAVLRFRSENVSHVVLLDNGGNITFNFPQYAESQGYRPRYAWNTFNAIGLEQQFFSPAQLRRSVGVGWQPVYDVAVGQAPPLSPTASRCNDLATKAGAPSSWGSARSKTYAYCDMLFHLQAAAAVAGTVAAQPLVAAVLGLGDSVPSAQTFRNRYAADRRFAAATARDLFFDDGCRCIQFRGPEIPVG